MGNKRSISVSRIIVLIGAVLMLGAVNFSIWQKENLLANGRVVFLELAPVDPRSLMQGDYMALRFRVADNAFGRGDRKLVGDGRIVVSVDDNNVASFKRLDDNTALAANEVRMRYRIRDDRPKFATNAFFFQEGHAKFYERARYGEFRVSEKGELLLTGLRGERFERLGPGDDKANL
jgi:uncharacterized membrane-anchored protein